MDGLTCLAHDAGRGDRAGQRHMLLSKPRSLRRDAVPRSNPAPFAAAALRTGTYARHFKSIPPAGSPNTPTRFA